MRHIDAWPTSDDDRATATDVPVVGVGASAGGLAAYQELLSHTPPDTGLAFVLVQHLDPGRESLLATLLQRYTRMPVVQAEDGIAVEANHVYTIPPNAELWLLNGELRLGPLPEHRAARLPIDVFFRALAAERKSRAIGIVLSGAGSDGTLGLRAIKDAGGLTIAQDPETAGYGAMPLSAIERGSADLVLPPAAMADAACRFVDHVATVGSVAPTAPELLDRLFLVLRDHSGHDFTLYRESTLLRRVERRMALAQISDMAEYVRHVQSDKREAEALFREVLIGVTRFFRDPEVFNAIETRVVPELLPDAGRRDPLRIWVPGCATGEEAYSIGILLRERMEAMGRLVPIQVFATDIDDVAIDVARAGIYPESIAAAVGERRLQRFFTLTESGFRVNQSVREMMVFSTQNLAQDPPFSHLDLLSCRNLLIYMKPALQRRVGALFHYALRADGFLILGNSETLSDLAPHFAVVDRQLRIYRRLPGSPLPRPSLFTPVRRGAERATTRLGPHPPPTPKQALESYLLAHHAPASVVVDEDDMLQYVHGHTGRYLEPPSGEVTTSLMKMARPGLRIPLATALYRARETGEQAVVDRVIVRSPDGERPVRLIVQPVGEPEALAGMAMVLFEELPPQPPTPGGSAGPASDDRVDTLTAELASTRQYLHAIVGQLESANQALSATNEELQSANEELQSANEELQTAKEELQSVNEELLTVNAELESKLQELSEANADMDNLFSAIDVGAVLLDLDLRIRRYTPNADRLISLIASDIGRPIGHTVCHLKGIDLVDVSREVLTTLEPQEYEVRHKTGAWFWMRARPYRTPDRAVQGVTLTFNDITPLKEAQRALEAARDRLEAAVLDRTRDLAQARTRLALAVRGSGGGLWYVDLDGPDADLPDSIYLSPEIKAIAGYSDDEFPDSIAAWRSLILPEDLPTVDGQVAAYRAGERPDYDVEYRIRHRDGTIRWLHSRGQIETGLDGEAATWAGIDWDITEPKQHELAVYASETRFRSLFQHIGSGVAVYDTTDGGETFLIRDINRAGERFSQVDRDAIVGRHIHEVFPAVEQIGLLAILQRVWRTGLPERLPMTHYADGRIEEWVENYVYRLPTGEVVAVYEDATEHMRMVAALRASEARLAALRSVLGDGLWLVDGAGRTMMATADVVALLGYSHDDLVGRPFCDFVAAEAADHVSGAVTNPAQAAVDVGSVPMVRKDGTLVACRLAVSTVALTPDDPAEVVVAVRHLGPPLPRSQAGPEGWTGVQPIDGRSRPRERGDD